MITEKEIKRWFILFLLILLIVLAFLTIKPILLAVLWGLIFAYIFYPVYKKINNSINHKTISALFICIFLFLIIFISLWFLVPIIIKQTFAIYTYINKADLIGQLKNIFPSLFSSPEFSEDFFLAVNTFIGNITSKFLKSLSSLLINIPIVLLNIFLGIVTFFFALRDGDKLKVYLRDLSIFTKESGEKFLRQFNDVTHSVVYGQIIIGIIQGLITGIGLFVFRVPNALLLTILAIFFSVFPVIGAWLVWFPAAIYLLVTGHFVTGICLLIFGLVIISWIDNFIRPMIVAKKTKMHTGLVWIGMIGGLLAFGLIGLILGPLIIAYLLIIMDFYRAGKFKELFSK